MKKLFLSLFLFLPLVSFCAEKDKVFLFSYFKGNGEDGLHLAFSMDGLRHGTVFQVSEKILSGLQNIVIAPDQ